jgi:hypothetical protein
VKEEVLPSQRKIHPEFHINQKKKRKLHLKNDMIDDG